MSAAGAGRGDLPPLQVVGGTAFGESVRQRLHRSEKAREFLIDDVHDDGVVGVEAVVGQGVPHPAMALHGTSGAVARSSGLIAFTASPISMSRTRTAS
jgi:hypothetical protein